MKSKGSLPQLIGTAVIVFTCLFLLQLLLSTLFDLKASKTFDIFQFGIIWIYIIGVPLLYISLKILHHFKLVDWIVEICAVLWVVLFIYSMLFIV
jgi:predicted ferric reductase